jgi:penicillin-binding protein-related factor A (putative recombinase)
MKKQRTRQHIIEDLGFNNVEKQVLWAGCIVQRYFADYGYDGEIQTFDENGFYENGYVLFQLKSTDSSSLMTQNSTISFDLSKRDLELWLYEKVPVLIILYDANTDISYFIELQSYFREHKKTLQSIKKFVRIYIPLENIFNIAAVQFVRHLKNGL